MLSPMKFDLKEAPDVISRLAERCVAHTLERLNFELDYHEDTLGVVDHAVGSIVLDEGEGARLPPAHNRRTDLVHLLAPTYGAYFGEVLRRTFPCRWRLLSEDPVDWYLEFEEVYMRFSPVGAAAEAFFGAPFPNWDGTVTTTPAEKDALNERLAASPPVFEDQFFNVTTRLEMLQICHEWLQARLGDIDAKTRYLSEEDYDREMPIAE